MEIQDGPLKNESDALIFQDAVVNKGESVKKLNQEEKDHKV